MQKMLRISALLIAASTAAIPAVASQLLTNGGFTTGFTGWTTNVQPGSSGNLFISNASTTPLTGAPTAAPINGNFALTDQTGPGAYSLTQSFTVAAGASTILSFDMFVNDWAGITLCGGGLDYTNGRVECGRVDILTGSATAFDTGAGVLATLYLGSDPGFNQKPFTHYSFDLSSLLAAGGTYQIRFGEADNQANLNLGVDNVSITSAASPVPEPSSFVLIGTGMLGAAGAIRRRLKRQR